MNDECEGGGGSNLIIQELLYYQPFVNIVTHKAHRSPHTVYLHCVSSCFSISSSEECGGGAGGEGPCGYSGLHSEL